MLEFMLSVGVCQVICRTGWSVSRAHRFTDCTGLGILPQKRHRQEPERSSRVGCLWPWPQKRPDVSRPLASRFDSRALAWRSHARRRLLLSGTAPVIPARSCSRDGAVGYANRRKQKRPCLQETRPLGLVLNGSHNDVCASSTYSSFSTRAAAARARSIGSTLDLVFAEAFRVPQQNKNPDS